MSTSSDSIFEIAQHLANLPSEAGARSSISRAYYSAFHSVVEALPEEYQPNFKEKSSHEALALQILSYSKTLKPGRTEAAQIADSLPKLKKKRKIADYFLGDDIDAAEVKKAIDIAEKIIKNSKSLQHKIKSSSAQ